MQHPLHDSNQFVSVMSACIHCLLSITGFILLHYAGPTMLLLKRACCRGHAIWYGQACMLDHFAFRLSFQCLWLTILSMSTQSLTQGVWCLYTSSTPVKDPPTDEGPTYRVSTDRSTVFNVLFIPIGADQSSHWPMLDVVLLCPSLCALFACSLSRASNSQNIYGMQDPPCCFTTCYVLREATAQPSGPCSTQA